MIKAARVVIIVASVTFALQSRMAIWFGIPFACECIYRFHLGYQEALEKTIEKEGDAE